MSETKEKYQQQILFDLPNDKDPSKQTLIPTEQVIFDNDTWQEDQSLDDLRVIDDADELSNSSTKPRWLWRTVGVLFGGLVVVNAVNYFSVGFVESPLTTSIVAAISACLVVISGTALFRELIGLRQFKQQQVIKSQVKSLLIDENSTTTTNINALALCEQISATLPLDTGFNWQESIQAEHNDKEIIQLYSRTVLSQVDQKAINEIAKFSTESVVLVALSPVALIDMLIMLWRNLRMINKISALYGLKLGYWSRIKLLKQVFMNMAYAGASEMLTDVGADMLGADLLGKISGRLAQGLGAGMLTARLGLRVLKLARPISYATPLLIEGQPKIAMIRKAVISQVSALIKK